MASMRMVIVSIVALGLFFIVTVSWYVTLPVTIGVARAINGTITLAQAQQTVNVIEYACYIWGPLFDGFIVLWWFMTATQTEVESRLYA